MVNVLGEDEKQMTDPLGKAFSEMFSATVDITRQFLDRVGRLEAAIRKHRDYRGDHRCWLDDEELYKVLPEGYTPPARDSAVEKKNCDRFIECRHNPATVYVSPETRIEELESLLREAEYACNDPEVCKKIQAALSETATK